MKRYYSVTEFAKYFDVSRQAVHKWINEDKVKTIKMPGGMYRIPKGQIKKIEGSRG